MSRWTPKPPLQGAAVFLSASVPHPQRDARFLSGPVEEWLMLRVIDQRVFDAVQALVAQLLGNGGRLVHGGHPTITAILASQAGNWLADRQSPRRDEGLEAASPALDGPKASSSEQDRNAPVDLQNGAEPPVLLYQSQFFAHLPAPSGRQEMQQAGFAAVRWTASTLAELRVGGVPLLERHPRLAESIEAWQPQQTAPNAPRALQEALLAMRLQMLLETRPQAAVCIGGMEGIEAEARLYTQLCDLGLLPGNGDVQVLRSTYGAAAQLEGERVRVLDERPPTSGETAAADLLERIAYDGVMRELVAGIRP